MPKRVLFFFVLMFFLFAIPGLYADPFTKKEARSFTSVRTAGAAPVWLVKQQAVIRENIAQVMTGIKNSEGGAGVLVLLLLSFIYGVFHAAGPGHRKSIVFAYFMTAKKARWYEPLGMGLALAVIHAGTSVLMVGAIALFTRRVFSVSGQANAFTEYIAYVILLVLSVYLLGSKLFELFGKRRREQGKRAYERKKLATVFLSGVIPCPGATLILIFSLAHGMLPLGTFAVFSMSLGMGLTIAVAGYMSVLGQQAIFYMLKNEVGKVERAGEVLEVLGLAMLLLFAAYMLFPFL